MNKQLKAIYSKRLIKVMENYRTGVLFDLGVRLKPIQIIEQKEEIIILCSNLDHSIVFDKNMFLKRWKHKV